MDYNLSQIGLKISSDYLLSINEDYLNNSEIYDLNLNYENYVCLDFFTKEQIKYFKQLVNSLKK